MNDKILKKFVAEIEHRYDTEESNKNSHPEESLKPNQSPLNEELRSTLLMYNFNCFMDEFN
ncbi:MAG: hypothetical protein LBI80_00510 [Endomicrobium sp.]|jgi:hypothetical protein|nr:hypothetical protein [Endomicrobium sp.]